MMTAIRFPLKKIISKSGGGRKVAARHQELAPLFGWKRLPEATIRTWAHRDTMDFDRFKELVVVAASMGRFIDLYDFLEIEEGGAVWLSMNEVGFGRRGAGNFKDHIDNTLQGEQNDETTGHNRGICNGRTSGDF